MREHESQTENYDLNRRVDRDSDGYRSELSQEISLKPLVRILWSYRRVIAASISIILIVFLVGGLGAYLFLPAERQASLEFRILFEGADQGRYPNSLAFSRSEIVSTPVLTAVYTADDLSRYCTYNEFKNRVFILESSPELQLLQLEYAAKLADTRLTPVDRAKLEGEFRQKLDALKKAQYTLNFVTPNGNRQIPEILMSKVLNDILATWAEQAVDIKAIFGYQIKVYTPNVLLKDFVQAEDYFVRVDILRNKINRIIEDVDELSELPGATVIRVGESRISLPEIRSNLEDIRQFKVEPLAETIREAGVTRDPNRVIQYVQNRLMQTRLDRQEAESRVTTLREALQAYTRDRGLGGSAASQRGTADSQLSPAPGTSALIPQLSESFLDRLVTISTQNTDAQYRQKLTDEAIRAGQTAVTMGKESGYYEALAASMRQISPARAGAADREITATIDRRLDELYSAAVLALNQIDAAYKELSKQNLNPRTSLYTLTSPFLISTQRVVTLRTIAIYALLTLMLSSLVVPMACIVHHYFKTEIFPNRAPAAGAKTPEDDPIQPKARSVGLSE
jgi:hypothetical protein